MVDKIQHLISHLSLLKLNNLNPLLQIFHHNKNILAHGRLRIDFHIAAYSEQDPLTKTGRD